MLWLNLDYTAVEIADWLATRSGLDAVTVSALTDADPRPRAIASDDHFLLILRAIDNNAGAAPIRPHSGSPALLRIRSTRSTRGSA